MNSSQPSASFRNATTIDEIKKCLVDIKSQNPHIRAISAIRLGELETNVDDVVKLLYDGNAYVRAAAIKALGFYRREPLSEQVTSLIIIALDDKSDRVCSEAIVTLGKLKVQGIIDEIILFLEDRNPYIVKAAIGTIGKLGQFEMGEMILPFLNSKNYHIETTAIIALNNLNFYPAGNELLIKFLDHIDSTKKQRLPLLRSYIKALGGLKVFSAINVLTDIAQNYVGLRSEAINALLELGATESVPQLIHLLSDPGVRIRKSIIRLAIGTRFSTTSLYLRPLLYDQNSDIRRSAIIGLTELRDVASLEGIREIAKHDSNPFIRILALKCLLNWDEYDALEDLIYFVDDQNVAIRELVLQKLSALETINKKGLEALVKLTSDSNDAIRYAACQILSSNNFVFSNDEGNDQQKNINYLPQSSREEKEMGIVFLKTWQVYLQDINHPDIGDELANIDQALSLLIHYLNE